MSLSFRVFFIGLFLLLIDWYFYQAVVTVLKDTSAFRRMIAANIYWGFTIFTFLLFLTPSVISLTLWPKYLRVYLFAIVLVVLFSKIIGSLFIATDDVIRLFRWIGSYFTLKTEIIKENPHNISRLKFLSQIALGITAIPLAAFIYGMVKGAFDYKIHTSKIILPNLPSAFNGFKIIQLSDIHLGSYVSTDHLEEAVKIIQKEKPDIIFFTGDLVNDRASEAELFMEVLGKLKAPHGVYSTLGNHDYGEYVKWDSKEAQAQNLIDMKNVHNKLGWKLLMNEHISVNKDDSEIAVIGVENWGGSFHFPKYGDLKKAHSGTEKYPVKLLLTHDPSHWDKQVIADYKDIDVTFSGHTHGGQFGIEIPRFRWSISQYAYKQWAGLYNEKNQYLYVNRGLGFLGYPGRVGISPEITIVKLFNA